MKHYLVLVYSGIHFQFDNLKFAQVTQFRASWRKIQKLRTLQSIMAKFNIKLPRSIYIIFVCIFRTIAQTLQKFTDNLKKIQNPIIFQIGYQFA